MKTKLTTLSLLTASALLLFNCGGSKKEEATHDDHATADSSAMAETTHAQFEVDALFQQQLAGLFTAYVSLKDAFVSSDASKVKAEAATTLQALAKTDMKLLTGAAHHDWMNYLGGLESSLKKIQEAADIEVQRESFSTLSDNLYKSIKAFGLGGVTAYYDFCPMAFDNQGAYWLSTEDKIRNPYFGDKMMTCGVVKETLK